MIKDAETLLFMLFKHYNVFTNNELSEKINTSAGTISKWKQRNSVNAIKKKCLELGIYKEIFEDEKKEEIKITSPSNISKEDINCKLFLFKRRSLIYLYYLLQKQYINSAIDYFTWQAQKDEENMFINFIDDLWHDFKNENVSFSYNRSEADRYISNLIRIDELDFIFQNKDIFMKSIIFMTDEKR